MKRPLIILSLMCILLLSVSSEAAYKIYLRNGSVITGVKSYEKKNGEIAIQFGGGAIGVPERDVLRIEEVNAPEKDFRSQEGTESQTNSGETAVTPPEPSRNGNGRRASLRAELDSINSELKTVEEDEDRVKTSIREKQGMRSHYNLIQLRNLERELEPLQQELFSIQQKKNDLIQRKTQVEGQLGTPE